MMPIKRNLATVALAGLFATPLYAQIVVRNDPTQRTPRTRVEDRTTVDSRTGVEGRRGNAQRRSSVTIPPGHLPPRGMCRVWIDGVPPGLQSPVTDCETAERNRVANSRVIYGDRETLRNSQRRARGQQQAERTCAVWDSVVIDGRVVDVCRDDDARRGRSRRGERDDDDDDNDVDDGNANDHDDGDDDDRGQKSKLSKSEKQAVKAARKSERGRNH